MNKNVATALTLLAAVIAMVLPIAIALDLAWSMARQAERDRALQYARDVMERSDATADQVDRGITRLSASPEPCSTSNLAAMRRIDVGSSYIQTIGQLNGTALGCSSIGDPGPVDLGRPDIVRDNGVWIWRAVRLPFAPDQTFIAIARDGFVAIIHKDLPIDVSAAPDVSLATLSRESPVPLTARGDIDTRWVDRLGNEKELAFIEHDRIVAVVASQRYATIAIAALPATALAERVQDIAATLVPIGLLASIVLASAVFYLARMQLAMPALLRGALRRREFSLVYQPVVDLQSGAWTGAEVLVRWQRRNGEEMRPDLFIHAAEDAGLIPRITKRVLQLVRQDARELFREHPHFHLAINLSPADLHDPKSIALVQDLARALGAAPGNLVAEVTERSFVHPDAARQSIRALRSAGIQVAIDDFGTGYSGLSYLESLQVDILKIDKSFVDTIASEATSSPVVPHIIGMARSLGLRMVAEGVETEAQAQFLKRAGVDAAQGWYFAKTMSYRELLEALSRR